MEVEKQDFLLTIAIPTYNRRDLLKRALDSIIPQLNPKIELLVSDNASDDGTDEMIVQSFPMVRYIKNEINKGADYNFLQCYREAKGKYVILLGSDDRIAAGAIDYLTNFLEKNDCDLVFLNFRCFDVTKKGIYIKNRKWIKKYSTKQDIVTTNKSLFMKYAGPAITFMSASIAKRELLMKVNEPERFTGTYFIHTNLMLESVTGVNALFGVIMQPFIEESLTANEAALSKTPEIAVSAYGKYLYSTLCFHAVECGFQKKQMRKVYLQYLHDNSFWKPFFSFRGRNNVKGIEAFWKDVYPVVKTYPTEWIKVMLVALAPQCIINMLYKVYKAFKGKNTPTSPVGCSTKTVSAKQGNNKSIL